MQEQRKSLLRKASKPGAPKLSLTMYPISTAIDKHVPLKLL